MKKNRVMLVLSYESIIKMLGLPDNYELLSVTQSEMDKGMERFNIIVSGEAGFEIPEGTTIPFLPIDRLKERIEAQKEVQE